VEFDPAAFAETERGGAPRSVAADRQDTDGRKPFLELEAHAGARKLPARGALGVVKEPERRFRIKRLIEQCR
jgi:hypothetical protein